MAHHDVFISHSAKNKVTADAVCAMLEAEGVRCWIAPRDVTPGMEWGECIIDAIEQSRIMVLVFTADANASPQIRREVERAVSHGVAILPLRLEDVMPARALEYFIGNVHWLDALTPPIEAHLKNLASTIKMLVARMEVHPEPPTPHAAGIVETPAPAPAPEYSRPVPVEPEKTEPPKPAPLPKPAPPVDEPVNFGFRKLEAVEFPKFDPPRPRTPDPRIPDPGIPDSRIPDPGILEARLPGSENSAPRDPVRHEPDLRKPEPRKPTPAPAPVIVPKPARVPAPAPAFAGNTATITLLLLFALNLLNSAARGILYSEAGLISEHLAMSGTTFRHLERLTPLWYALAALLVGWLGDRIPRKPFLIAAAAILSLSLFGMYMSIEPSSMVLFESLIWAVGAVFDVFALSTIADLYSERQRPLAFMLFCLGFPLSTMFVSFDIELLSPQWGWGVPITVAALAGAAATGLYAWLGREPKRGAMDSIAPVNGTALAKSSALARIFTSPACILLLVAAIALRIGGTANSSALRYMSNYLEIPISTVTRSMGGSFAVTSFLGILGGGLLGWSWLKKDRRALYLVAAAGAGLAFVFFAALAFGPASSGATFFIATNLFLAVPTALLLAAFANSVAAPARTTAFSFLMGFTYFFGGFLFLPLLDAFAESPSNLFGPIRTMLVFFAAACAALIIGARFAPALGAEKKPDAAQA